MPDYPKYRKQLPERDYTEEDYRLQVKFATAFDSIKEISLILDVTISDVDFYEKGFPFILDNPRVKTDLISKGYNPASIVLLDTCWVIPDKDFYTGNNIVFSKPTRVWVNSPSMLNPFHNQHGKTGIAHTYNNDTTIYFEKGNLISMLIDPMYLSIKNSNTNIFELVGF